MTGIRQSQEDVAWERLNFLVGNQRNKWLVVMTDGMLLVGWHSELRWILSNSYSIPELLGLDDPRSRDLHPCLPGNSYQVQVYPL